MILSVAYLDLFSFQDTKDSSLLERQKKRKDRIKNKGTKKKKKNLQEVDRKIEDVLQKKGAVGGGWVCFERMSLF